MRSMSLLLFVRLMSAMGSTADPQLSLKFKLANGSFRPIAGIQFFNLLCDLIVKLQVIICRARLG